MVQSLRLYHFYCPNEAVWASGSGELYCCNRCEKDALPFILIDFIRGLAYNIKEVLILVLHIVERSNMEYLSIKQTSDKWGISVRRIQVLCSEDRIPGATKIGSYWAIPADAEKPDDQRIKSGKYIKEK